MRNCLFQSLWLKIGATVQKEFGVSILLHLTCHLPRVRNMAQRKSFPLYIVFSWDLESTNGAHFHVRGVVWQSDLVRILQNVRDAGITNILALRWVVVSNQHASVLIACPETEGSGLLPKVPYESIGAHLLIRSILEYRGDPPIGEEHWKPVPGGLRNAIELVQLIRLVIHLPFTQRHSLRRGRISLLRKLGHL